MTRQVLYKRKGNSSDQPYLAWKIIIFGLVIGIQNTERVQMDSGFI
jgi:hypothetical protein